MERKSFVVAALVIALMFSLMIVPAVALEEVEWLCEQEGGRSGAEIRESLGTTFSEWRVWDTRNPETGDIRCFPLSKNIGLPDDELVTCSCEFDRLDGAICLLGISTDGAVCGGDILAKDCSNIKHATCTERGGTRETTGEVSNAAEGMKTTAKPTDLRERYHALLEEAMPTAEPTAKPTARSTTAEPTARPTPKSIEPYEYTHSPGFESVFAIAGLLVVAYLVRRRR